MPQRRSVSPLAIGLTVAATLVGAVLLVFAPLAIAVWSYRRDGMGTATVVWLVVAAVWLGALVRQAIRSRETRGWLAFALVGWIAVLFGVVRRAVRR